MGILVQCLVAVKFTSFITIDLDIENLRVADDMTTDRKATSIAAPDNSPQRNAIANNFANIFGKLEGMDGDSTLMAGFDDDDEEDTPPPLVKPQNLPVNQKYAFNLNV